jgi:hypothetical protein
MPVVVGFRWGVQAHTCGEPCGATSPLRLDGDLVGQFGQAANPACVLSGGVIGRI